MHGHPDEDHSADGDTHDQNREKPSDYINGYRTPSQICQRQTANDAAYYDSDQYAVDQPRVCSNDSRYTKAAMEPN